MLVMEKQENLMIVVEQRGNGSVSGWSFKCSDERRWPWENRTLVDFFSSPFYIYSSYLLDRCINHVTPLPYTFPNHHYPCGRQSWRTAVSPGSLFSVLLYWYIGILHIGTVEPLLCDTVSIQRTQDLVSEKRPHNLCICYLYVRDTSIKGTQNLVPEKRPN